MLSKMHDSTSENTVAKSYALEFEHPLTLPSRLGLTPGGIFCCAGARVVYNGLYYGVAAFAERTLP